METNLSAKRNGVAELNRYWERLEQGGFHAHPDPERDAPDLAPNLMLIDIVNGGFRYRYYGKNLSDKLGDQTGKAVGVSTPLDEAVKLRWLEILRTVVASNIAQVLECKLDGGPGAYLVVMPLKHRDGDSILAGHFFYGPTDSRVIIRGWHTKSLNTVLAEIAA